MQIQLDQLFLLLKQGTSPHSAKHKNSQFTFSVMEWTNEDFLGRIGCAHDITYGFYSLYQILSLGSGSQG